MTFDAPTRPARHGRRCLSLLVLACVLTLPSIARAQAPVCSNGIIEAGETCDDGNLLDGDGCTAACAIEQDCYDPGNTFSFFLWSDSYGSAGETGAKRVLEDAVNRTLYPNRLIPRFWISAGDIPYMELAPDKLDRINDRISNSPTGQRYPFSCTSSNGRFPYFVALGNHDVDGYLDTTPESQYAYWSTQVGPTLNSTLVGITNFQQGPTSPDGHDALTNYSFDYKNTHFVIVNQYFEDPGYPTATPLGCMRQSLLDWIDQDLAASTRPVKFVAGHEPAWSYCASIGGSGGAFCPAGHEDNLPLAFRPRPWSPYGDWNQPFGRHWRGSLDEAACPAGSREAFWQIMANRGAVAHLSAHTHSYSARLVQGDGTRRNDVPAYSKTGETFTPADGVWEVDSAQAHTSSGAAYVVVTVRDNMVTFETWDQEGTIEPFTLVETWNVMVAENTAPTLAAIGDQSGAEGAATTFTASAADGDLPANTLTYSLANAPAGASIDPSTGVFSWTPSEAEGPGIYSVTVRVTDNGAPPATDEETITITVTEINAAPELATIGDLSFNEHSTIAFSATASDSDIPANGLTFTFSLANAPAGASIDPGTGVFSWTPDETQGLGTYSATIRVTDDGSPAAFDEETMSITIDNVNDAPALAPIGNRSGAEQATFAFTALAEDNDLPGNVLTFSLAGAPSGATIDPATGAFSWTPSEADGPGALAVTIRVTDDGTPSASDEETITLTVDEIDVPPVLPSIPNTSVAELVPISFAAPATDTDIPANTLTYSLSSGPAGAAIDPSTSTFTWTPSEAQGPGSHVVVVRVTDSGTPAVFAEVSVTITVSEVNQSPVLSPIGNTSVAVQNPLTFTASATDADLPAQALSFGLQGAPAGATINPATGVFTWTPTGSQVGVYAFSVTVADNHSPAGTALWPVSVTVTGGRDLVMSAASTGTTAIAPGSTLSLSNTVLNQGSASTGGFTIAFHLSPDAVYGGAGDVAFSQTRTPSGLSAGASSAASTSLTIPGSTPLGLYYVCALADSAGVVNETVETNNGRCTAAATVNVTRPDLIVTALAPNASSVRRGRDLSVTDTVRNQGLLSAGESRVHYRLSINGVYGDSDDVVISSTRSVNGLSAGSQNTGNKNITVPSNAPLGFYRVCGKADGASAVTEANENNNTFCSAGTVEVRN